MKASLLTVAAATLCLAGSAAMAQGQAPTDPLNPGPNPTTTETPLNSGGTQEDQDKTDDPAEIVRERPAPPVDRGTLSNGANDAAGMVVTPPGAEGARGPGPERMAGGKGGRRGPRDMMPPPPSKAAMFEIENGAFHFRVKCADDEPMQACADIASKLFGEAKGLPMP